MELYALNFNSQLSHRSSLVTESLPDQRFSFCDFRSRLSTSHLLNPSPVTP
jgi:hypothetical protein